MKKITAAGEEAAKTEWAFPNPKREYVESG